jgi:rhodanese-related sulfurtransferase
MNERRTINDLLADARDRLERLEPPAANAAHQAGALLVDIRSDVQREADGVVPGALFFPRNVLEWRLDPASGHADPRVPGPGAEVIVMCNDGYQSSLAAATLQELGFARATDLVGGYQAWRAAGLPVEPAGTAD